MADCPQRMLFAENVVTFLLGVALAAFSVYVIVAYAAWAAFVSLNEVYIALGAGCFMMVTACFGFAAASKKHVGALVIYAILCTIALAASSAAALISIAVSQNLGAITGTPILSGSVVTQTYQAINDEILSAYVSCCEGCTPQQACTNTKVPMGSTPLCPLGACNTVAVCAPSAYNSTCFSSSTALVPPQAVDASVCAFLASVSGVTIKGVAVPIVGNVTTYSCGTGFPATFASDALSYFSPKLVYVASGLCAVAGIQLIDLLTLIFLITHLHRKQKAQSAQ